jgi:phosphoribosylformylglycinamidine (FGAM) synthase-like amidotransferase family enzyme
VICGGGHLFIHYAEHLVRWDNVQHRQLAHALRMIQRQAMRHARSAVMANHGKRLIAKLLHDLNLILCHGPFGIGDMVRIARWLAAVAIAPQVRDHHSKILRQAWGKPVPHHMRLRIAVQQQ